jgi:hypothetical protein
MRKYNVEEARPRVRDTYREKQPSLSQALCNSGQNEGGHE